MAKHYYTKPRPRYVKGLHLGQKIRVWETINLDGNNNILRIPLDYVVTKIHPFIVETKRNLESRVETRCFSIGDLVTMGLMQKGGEWFEEVS